MAHTPLKQVPSKVEDGAGRPAFGSYVGGLEVVDFSRLQPPYGLSRARRMVREKRWQYQLVVTPDVVACFAVTDLTYSASAFACVVDLARRRAVFDGSFVGLPGPLAKIGDRPGQGQHVRFRVPGARFSTARRKGEERYRVDVSVAKVPLVRPGLSWKGSFLVEGGPPPLTVIAPVSGGSGVNVTQKWGGLLSFGTLEAGGRTYRLDGGVGGLDYTHGYLARHTAWRWALALGRLQDGTPVGLNLVEGFNDEQGANENALWVGKTLYPLSQAHFSFNRRDPLDRWTVATSDGEVALEFRPLHVHREERHYKVVESRFAQPLGTFSGELSFGGRTVKVQLAGVTEDQDILW